MDSAQRACWLGAGLFVERESLLPALVDFVSRGRDSEGKAGALVHFLVPKRKPLGDQEWPTAELIALVRAVGARLSSPWDERHGSSGHFLGDSFAIGTKVDALVNNWLDTLAGRVDEEAVAGLRSLADDPALNSWQGRLLRAGDDQMRRLRMEAYTPPSLPEIRNALGVHLQVRPIWQRWSPTSWRRSQTESAMATPTHGSSIGTRTPTIRRAGKSSSRSRKTPAAMPCSPTFNSCWSRMTLTPSRRDTTPRTPGRTSSPSMALAL